MLANACFGALSLTDTEPDQTHVECHGLELADDLGRLQHQGYPRARGLLRSVAMLFPSVCSSPTQDSPSGRGHSVPKLNTAPPNQGETHECNTLKTKPAVPKLLES